MTKANVVLSLVFAAGCVTGGKDVTRATAEPATPPAPDVTCEAPKASAPPAGVAADDAPALEELVRSMSGVTFEIPVKDLECGNPTMSEQMRTSLRGSRDETIQFALTRDGMQPASGTTVPLRLVGEITLAGKTRPVAVDATATATGDGRVRVLGSYPMKMSEWGESPPRKTLGTVQVSDTVQIRFDLAVTPE